MLFRDSRVAWNPSQKKSTLRKTQQNPKRQNKTLNSSKTRTSSPKKASSSISRFKIDHKVTKYPSLRTSIFQSRLTCILPLLRTILLSLWTMSLFIRQNVKQTSIPLNSITRCGRKTLIASTSLSENTSCTLTLTTETTQAGLSRLALASAPWRGDRTIWRSCSPAKSKCSQSETWTISSMRRKWWCNQGWSTSWKSSIHLPRCA